HVRGRNGALDRARDTVLIAADERDHFDRRPSGDADACPGAAERACSGDGRADEKTPLQEPHGTCAVNAGEPMVPPRAPSFSSHQRSRVEPGKARPDAEIARLHLLFARMWRHW